MDFIRKVKDKLEERPECQDKVIFNYYLIIFILIQLFYYSLSYSYLNLVFHIINNENNLVWFNEKTRIYQMSVLNLKLVICNVSFN